MSEEMSVDRAECCFHCANVDRGFSCRDSVLCKKCNEYILNTDVCELFERVTE